MSKLERTVKVEVSNSIDDIQVNVNIMLTSQNAKISIQQKQDIEELKRNVEQLLINQLSQIL